MNKKTLKERIIDTSLLLFEEKGYHGVSVEEIVEKTGTSKGGFYHNFKSKDELLYQIHDGFISSVIEKAQEAYNEFTSPISKLCAILHSFMKVSDVYKSHITVFYQESNYLPNEFQQIIHDKRNQYGCLLEQVIREGQKTGDFRKEVPANITTMAIIGMMNWTYKWFDQRGKFSKDEITEIFKDLILHSLLTETGEKEAIERKQLISAVYPKSDTGNEAIF